MNINERRLNGRDVLAKTFPAKTKKGYDPIDVDAYLELVASQVDLLHDDIVRAAGGGASATETTDVASLSTAGVAATGVAATGIDAGAQAEELARVKAELTAAVSDRDTLTSERDSLTSERDSLTSERDSLTSERDTIKAQLDDEVAAAEHLRAENAQLRTQLMATAPPPPTAPPAPAPTELGDVDDAEIVEAVEVDDVVEVDAIEEEETTAVVEATAESEASAAIVPATSSEVLVADDRASRESYELILHAAQRTAEEAISAAHVRADEIVADANLTAERIAQESDRKAYEAANRAQGELAAISNEIASHQGELDEISGLAEKRRNELRRLGESILSMANEDDEEGVLDLRDSQTSRADSLAELDDARS